MYNLWEKCSLHTNLVQTFPDQVLNGKTGEALKAANLSISWQFGFEKNFHTFILLILDIGSLAHIVRKALV